MSASNELEPIDQRISQLLDLEEHCVRVSDLPGVIGESCKYRLNDYFESRFIWNMSMLVIYEQGQRIVHAPIFDQRALVLPYTEADTKVWTSAGTGFFDPPRWRDIFDSQEKDRWKVVAQVFYDKTCRRLEKPASLSTSYWGRCQARELSKYAMYLDACMTGFDRSEFLHKTVGKQGLTRYGRARQTMDSSLASDGELVNNWQLIENYLLSIWLSEKCAEMSFTPLVASVNRSANSFSIGTLEELAKVLRPVYDTAMAIAARSGDPWAMQSFYTPALDRDFDYWMSLRVKNRHLHKRWMELIEYSPLEKKDRAFHAIETYRKEKKYSPSLNLLEYLSKYGIELEDFGLSKDRLDTLIEETQAEGTLESPWSAE